MTELRVPAYVRDPFRAHFRELVVGSLLRSAEDQMALHQASGHQFRARKAELAAQRLAGIPGAPPMTVQVSGRWFGPRTRRLTFGVWIAVVVLLVADVLTLGLHSPVTIFADGGVIVVTFIAFFVSVDGIGGPPG